MTKSEIREIEAARKTGDTTWVGRKLAILHRCASPRSAKEIRTHNCKTAGCGPVCTFGDF